MNTHRFFFAGFRHPHIFALYERVAQHPGCVIAGAWEADEATRRELAGKGQIALTHDSLESLLADAAGAVVVVGDTYGRRGPIAIAALEAGAHLISDKPLCTQLGELDRIERLAKEKGRSVGCQLDLTESPILRRLRGLIRRGELGAVQTVTISAQHPLRYGSRAAWYFERGQHGGTINDIGVHVFDLLPWLVEAPWARVLSARDWNAKAGAVPYFRDCAQVHGLLENGVSCFADLSYLAPDKAGYGLPQYWRITVHGSSGLAEASYGAGTLFLTRDGDDAAIEVSATAEPDGTRDYLQNFLDEIDEKPPAGGVEHLTTENILRTARLTLDAQQQATNAHEN